MARAGRPAKVTKWSLHNAIAHCKTVSDVARYLDVDRHTVYDAAKRFGVDLSTAFKRISTPIPAVQAPSLRSVPPEPPKPVYVTPADDAPKPQPDIRRLTANDFTGQNFGDTGRYAPRWGSMEARYRRLKGY